MTATATTDGAPFSGEFRTVLDLPPGWRPVPSSLRSTTPAPCDRCGTITRLVFGPGEALCALCEIAELLDRREARRVAAS